NVRAGQYLFYALAPAGYVNIIKPIPVEVPVGQNIVELNVRLKNGGNISGVVYQGDGVTPMAGVPVSAATLDGGVGAGLTGADGRYTVTGLAPSASYRVTVFAIGQAAVVQQGVAVAAGTTTTLNLTASSFATEVRGTVVDAVMSPIPHARVVLSLQAPETAGDLSGSIGLGVTDTSGTFSIRGLKPGTYKAQVQAEGYDPAEQADIVVLPSGTVTLSFTLAIKTGAYGQPFYAEALSPFGRVPGPDLLPAAGGVPLAPEFVPLILRVACPPPPPDPDPLTREMKYNECVKEASLEYLKAVEHALMTEIVGQVACALIVAGCLFTGGPPLAALCLKACEAGLAMLALGEIALAKAALDTRLAICEQNRTKPPPPPDSGPCDCTGPDCKPPGGDRPDDWRGVPGLGLRVQARLYYRLANIDLNKT
ncbi:MAG: carboxypeptidase regulatory-like domain-containing protein, partial [Chloroflexi bacterium]|nr:carboxypeptidase regulatory-like domain-containing protein [Chloroflexota bacterium]